MVFAINMVTFFVFKKTAVPYKNRLDLPEGSQQLVEGLTGPQVTTSEAVSDGANDSLGYIWMDIQEITEENASPLVLKVKSELLGFPELDKTSYMNWKVK